ncbi:MAG: hypothetical protein IJB27_02990 [Clostridia bacterium]|nr:hypothetical protein [Clostridia bacterium]
MTTCVSNVPLKTASGEDEGIAVKIRNNSHCRDSCSKARPVGMLIGL